MNAARLRRSGGSRASSKLLEFCDLIPSRSRNRGTRHQQTYRKQRSCLDYVADEPNKTKRPRVHGVAELAKKGGESQERHALRCCLSCRRRHDKGEDLLADASPSQINEGPAYENSNLNRGTCLQTPSIDGSRGI